MPGLLFVKNHRCRIVAENKNSLGLYPAQTQGKITGYTTFETYPADQRDRTHTEDRRALGHGGSEVVQTIDGPGEHRRTLLSRTPIGLAEGAGLGLHRVQRSAPLLGGHAQVEPHEPGSMFIVRLIEGHRQWS